MRHELTNWKPRELVLAAVQQPLESFTATCGSDYLLVVTLDAPGSELAQGLDALTVEQAPIDDAAVQGREYDSTLTLVQDRASMPNLLRTWDPATKRVSRPAEQIPADLRKVPCHVVAIRKRGGGSFLQHVTVGRARNHDIVLRHPSVSKFHAWFETHQAPELYIKDVGSQNHTFVNGQQTTGRLLVSAGQTLRFGTVVCTLCTPEGLWSAVHS